MRVVHYALVSIAESMNRGLVIAVSLLALLVVTPLVVLLFLFPTETSPYAWGVAAGVPSGLLILVVTYYLQQPRFTVTPIDGTYDPKMGAHWVHLRVENTSSGFIGGGTATNCVGEIRLANGNTFKPKWETRLNPFKLNIIPIPVSPTPVLHPLTGLPGAAVQLQTLRSVDPSMIEEASRETLRPGDWKSIDVAVRFADEESCYIHEPENFLTEQPLWRPARTRAGVGTIPFDFRLKWDTGTSPWKKFEILNLPGGDPGNLRVAERAA